MQPSLGVLDIDGYVFSGFAVLVKRVQAQPHFPVLGLGEDEFSAAADRLRQAGAAGYPPRAELVDRLISTVRTLFTQPTTTQPA